jgi:S1-C subfamily serine protease
MLAHPVKRATLRSCLTRYALFAVTMLSSPAPSIAQSDYLPGLISNPGTLSAYRGPSEVADLARSTHTLTHDDFPLTIADRTLRNLRPDAPFATRSVRDAKLFARVSPAVVLVVTNDGLGSGSLISRDGVVLTNWHVVSGSSDVGIIFKPTQEGAKPARSDIRRASVIKLDEVADLALVKVNVVPPGVTPITLGDVSDIGVGIDVHAIGHPTGEAWSYTKGVVSQYRREYEWQASGSAQMHKASVVQTQTPINPGNSGGPLLVDSGNLIGVNSFKAAQAEGLNFAVSIEDIKAFLSRSGNRIAPRKEQSNCEGKEVYRGQNEERTGNVVGMDLDCDGKADAELRIPNDRSEPILFVFDRNRDHRPDVVVFDTDRDGKWDFSFWDNDFDGKWDLVGFHPDGSLKAARFEPYDSVTAKLASRK